MSVFRRAAPIAAIFASVALFAGTSPGFASDLAHSSVTATTLNSLTMPAVPTAAAEPSVPTELPSVQSSPVQPTQPTAKPAMVQAMPASDAEDDDAADFASLSAAVAAQDADDVDRELNCLAAGVYFESNGEPLAGQLAVAQTIINRTTSGRFPKSICAVIAQRGQFSFVRGGVVPSAAGRSGWKTAVAVAKVAQRDLWEGAASDALYFHARRVAPGWRMARVASIGNHIFYR